MILFALRATRFAAERSGESMATGIEGAARGTSVPASVAGTKVEAQGGVKVVTSREVLKAEYELLYPGDPAPETELDYVAGVQREEQAALCLSGGGIRSAAFALGALQALSEKRLLNQFHYLSTVSGGGYIGSWLQRWIYEAKDYAKVMDALSASCEPPEVCNLRENSNFLTPRAGVASNDTWTAVALSIRNIAINWLLFAPLLMLIALVPNLFASGILSIPSVFSVDWQILVFILFLAMLILPVAIYAMLRALPSYRRELDCLPGTGDGWLMGQVVLPLIVCSVLGTLAIAIVLLESDEISAVFGGIGLGLLAFTAMCMGLFAAMLTRRGGYRGTIWRDKGAWLTAMLIASIFIGIGPVLFHRLISATSDIGFKAALLATFGPIWLLGSQTVLTIAFVALRPSHWKQGAGDGTIKPDGDREWLARLTAVKFKPMLVWVLAAFSVLLLGPLLDFALEGYDLSFSGLLALAGGSAAAFGGKAHKSGNVVKTAGSFLVKYLPLQALIALGTFVFAVGILMFMGRLEGKLAELIVVDVKALKEDPDSVGGFIGGVLHNPWTDPLVMTHLLIIGALVLLLWFLSGRIDVNRFSLNSLYRNRLARAFLGGARPNRDPDPITGFDSADNMRMHALAPKSGPARLYPVINVALNVTNTEKLAWQERKAEPFIFSPLYSGSASLRPEDHAGTDRPGAYISSDSYGGSEPDLAMPGSGVSLATATSISGAAASPNMGYHSSPATAFLMTLFNVRLGAWLPNPARAITLKKDVSLSGPNQSLRALLREMAGATDDRGRDIYLSDGGHFENLGVYEMVRRRCRYIVVTDAGADPQCSFEDLGNAVRKVKIDFGVDIQFGPMHISRRGENIKPQFAWALGEVKYPERGARGKILYLKPSFFGRDLPVDVVSYAATSPSFPHETTGDQFFSESQFESYRNLGQHFMRELGGKHATFATIEKFFEAVEKQRPPLMAGG